MTTNRNTLCEYNQLLLPTDGGLPVQLQATGVHVYWKFNSRTGCVSCYWCAIIALIIWGLLIHVYWFQFYSGLYNKQHPTYQSPAAKLPSTSRQLAPLDRLRENRRRRRDRKKSDQFQSQSQSDKASQREREREGGGRERERDVVWSAFFVSIAPRGTLWGHTISTKLEHSQCSS